MLIRFGVKNHLSIRDYQELSCVASAGYDDLPHTLHVENIKQKEQDFLPVIAVYGANAAGKSNILNAFHFFRRCIARSSKDWGEMEKLPQRWFSLDSSSCDSESLYDCDFLIDEVRYQYGFAINQKIVTKEWLYAYPKGIRNILFQRDFTEESEMEVYFGPSLKKIDPVWKKIADEKNKLLLSSAGRKEMQHDQLSPVFNYFKNRVSVVSIGGPDGEVQLAEKIQDGTFRDRIAEALKIADFGIVGIEIEKITVPDEAFKFTKNLVDLIRKQIDIDEDDKSFPMPSQEQDRIYLRHLGTDGKTYSVRYDDESTGTKYLMRLLIPVMSALENGNTLIVDEITTNLHTKLSEKIVNLFTSKEINKKNAQFIFSTHDTNLLSRDLLRRDEIWFAEKNNEDATDIYPLSDFKIRKSDNVEKGYLQGRFGAIPFLGDISSLLR